jgi:DNA polymerase
MVQALKDKLLRSLYIQQSLGFKYSDNINYSLLYNENEKDGINENDIENCNLCDLYKFSDKKCAFLGSRDSKIAIVSTKVIQNDAEKELLNNMIANVLKANPEDFLYLSLIKCQIGDNVNYSMEQIDSCSEFIEQQLSSPNIKLIVALGDSYNLLTNENHDLANIRGKSLQYKHHQIIPLYHPSIILRNPSLKKDTFEDLKKIKSIMDRM